MLGSYTVTKLGSTFDLSIAISLAYTSSAMEYFDIIVPATVTSIDIYAFSGYIGPITSITINGNAFWDLSDYNNIYLIDIFRETFDCLSGTDTNGNVYPNSIDVQINCPFSMTQDNFNYGPAELPFIQKYYQYDDYPGKTLTFTVYKEQSSSFNITYDASTNGGTCSTATGATSGGVLSSLPTPTKSGYTFAGWYLSSTSRTTQVTTSTVFNANTTIYAHFYKDISASCQTNGATSVSSASISGRLWNTATGVTVTLPTITRSGYTIVGWGSASTSTTANIGTAGGSYTLTASVTTIYAITYKTLSLTLNANGGTLNVSSPLTANVYNTNTTVTITVPSNAAGRTGYNLLGWGTNQLATTPDASLTYTISSDTTVYAVWKNSPNMKIKVSGTYKTGDVTYVKVSGVWKPATAVYVKVSGTWKQ